MITPLNMSLPPQQADQHRQLLHHKWVGRCGIERARIELLVPGLIIAQFSSKPQHFIRHTKSIINGVHEVRSCGITSKQFYQSQQLLNSTISQQNLLKDDRSHLGTCPCTQTVVSCSHTTYFSLCVGGSGLCNVLLQSG